MTCAQQHTPDFRVAYLCRDGACVTAPEAALLQSLNIPLVANAQESRAAGFTHVLESQQGRLCLSKLSATQALAPPWYIDWLQPELLHRIRRSTPSKESVLRALGVKAQRLASTAEYWVLDTTAGVGRDALLMASYGCQVVMLERSAVLFLLLRDAWQRLAAQPEYAATAGRMQVLYMDSVQYLQACALSALPLSAVPPMSASSISAPLISAASVFVAPQNAYSQKAYQAIYVDPMFVSQRHKAAPNKSIAWLRELPDLAEGAEHLCESALAVKHCRVVIKQPRVGARRLSRSPTFQLRGKRCRFDVFVT